MRFVTPIHEAKRSSAFWAVWCKPCLSPGRRPKVFASVCQCVTTPESSVVALAPRPSFVLGGRPRTRGCKCAMEGFALPGWAFRRPSLVCRQLRLGSAADLGVTAITGVSPVSWADLEVLGNKVATKKAWRSLKVARAKVLTDPESSSARQLSSSQTQQRRAVLPCRSWPCVFPHSPDA